ncbi:hypothetical protein K6119_14770 [Paracrocinitomix mangrovi]|uniref:glycosyltransferase n=1 Tax=Paracrocinitomix mangrovi TaxID=2862509 RepID=UPI001C8DF6CC|nr:hypothetical protein [Paracrocinitomix mangrovi]UKN00996.1 hypothetical protein K6119_14770 [Paracrocinitomix mangrovi]
MSKKLHIISFDVPFPATYGGIVDVFYKLKKLHELGVDITLHCYHYKDHNPPTKELEKYCSKVFYYERKQSILKLLFSRLPYIVSSRNSPELLSRIASDPAAVLMEGVHSTFWILHKDLKDLKLIFRAHNIEHEYYLGLAKAEKNWLKKIYLNREANKLLKYEWELRNANAILSISKRDTEYFKQYADTIHIPPFFDDSVQTDLSNESEKFVLFHGNLSVPENDKVARHIINYIASVSNQKFVIAGKNPSKQLVRLAGVCSNVDVVNSPTDEQLNILMKDAHINLLMSFQQTGVKLKLLNALQKGRHIIINEMMDDDGIFKDLCTIENEDEAIVQKIDDLMEIPFTAKEQAERNVKFKEIFNNESAAQKIIQLL